jgi:bacterioferritin-associated ferredoxin
MVPPFEVLVRNVAEATDEQVAAAVRQHFAPDMKAIRTAFEAMGAVDAFDAKHEAVVAQCVARMRELSRQAPGDSLFTLPKLLTVEF